MHVKACTEDVYIRSCHHRIKQLGASSLVSKQNRYCKAAVDMCWGMVGGLYVPYFCCLDNAAVLN